tara:strand:+ start:241 stop:435 length:195 start_codon:yes stop_codon:yes gene_type:complete
MSKPSIGMIAMWVGELSANLEHMKSMAIHQMDDAQLDEFAKYVRDANYAIASLTGYVKDAQEQP